MSRIIILTIGLAMVATSIGIGLAQGEPAYLLMAILIYAVLGRIVPARVYA